MFKKILIVHLVSNGDCLMMTAIAKQIKLDNPGCHLTWAIGYKCKQVIENNPDVDHIWEIKYADNESPFLDVYHKVKHEAEQRKKQGDFDKIIYSQISPDNHHHFDGTTRSSTFRAYDKPILDVTPVINLYNSEIKKVSHFAEKYELKKYKHIVLCECAPSSGQSFMSINLMIELAQKLVIERDDALFIISTHIKIKGNHSRIIDASELSYRENAELSKFCTLLVGCSSGITWLLSSNWAKKLNTIQFLKNTVIPFQFASVAYDFEYWGLSTDHILESTEQNTAEMFKIIDEGLNNFSAAKKKYHTVMRPSLKSLEQAYNSLTPVISLANLNKMFFFINNFYKRNGVKKSNVYILIISIIYKRGLSFIGRKLSFNIF